MNMNTERRDYLIRLLLENGFEISYAKPPMRSCEICKKKKPDVCRRPDYFAREIYGEEGAFHSVCDDCDYGNRQEI